MRGIHVLLIGVALLVASPLAFSRVYSPTPALGISLLTFGVVLTGFGWHLRFREGVQDEEQSMTVSDESSSGDQSPSGDPQAAQLGKPKALFWNRPIVSDWLFWVVIVFTLIGGGGSIYRTGQGFKDFSDDAAYVLFTGVLEIGFTAVVGPLWFAAIPGLIRFLIRRAMLKRKLSAVPEDLSVGWKVDPVNAKQHRWWSESGWTQATDPPKSRKIGTAGVLVYGAMCLVIATSFFAGLTSSASNTQGQPPVAGNSNQAFSDEALEFAAYFGDLLTSIESFFAVQEDPQNLAGGLTQSRVAFKEVESNFALMNQLVQNATDPADIGLKSEQFAAMEDVMTALDLFVEVRADFFSELDACGMGTSGMLGACEYEVLDSYSAFRVDTIPPVNDTLNALKATLEP